VQLSRNSGEQRAVLAGLRQCRGDLAAIIDDDGQQPAAEVARLFEKAEEQEHDVVFGRYTRSRHAWHRRLVSRLHNAAAGRLFGKPPGLYLSSFKVVNRYLIDRLLDSSTPFVHIDAMVLQITDRFVQVEVEHRERTAGRSGYTYRKLFAVWFEALLGYSLLPFRGAMAIGTVASVAAVVVIAVRALSDTQAIGSTPILSLLLGMILFYLGLLGECIVRWSNTSDATASSIVRYVFRRGEKNG
jgi:undecaprenyl-phosphate 4-deoxy-4-formamido-L-arabinose transferase